MLTSLPRVDAPTPLRPLKALSREDRIINQAIGILERRMFANGPHLLGLEAAKDYLHLMLAPEPSEVFAVVFLTSQHQVITCETLFRGTIDTTTVHPRVVIQRSLVHNAAAIIVAHQHPFWLFGTLRFGSSTHQATANRTGLRRRNPAGPSHHRQGRAILVRRDCPAVVHLNVRDIQFVREPTAPAPFPVIP